VFAPVLMLAVSACRSGVEPFAPPHMEPNEDAVFQLTFNPGEDRDPVWGSSEALYYAAQEFAGLPGGAGVLARIPAEGGTALRIFPELQNASARRWLAMPAPAPTGDRLAFFEMTQVATPSLLVGPLECEHAEPLLDSAVLHIRTLTASNAPDIVLGVKFPGRDPRQKAGQPGPYMLLTHPFQRMHSEQRDLLLRPSWSPDGQRVVFSDGVRLLIWIVGAAAATEVPGTADGVSPAWSPSGEWIAFSRLQRGPESTSSCSVRVGNSVQTQVRTGFDDRPARLARIRPDGSGLVDLGEGMDPAWSPDGQSIYIVRNGRIMRVAIDGSGGSDIAGTEFGRTPAVSEDGALLVFTRPAGADSKHDLWLARLR
jgi:hypothetical protein